MGLREASPWTLYPSAPYTPCQLPWVVESAWTNAAVAATGGGGAATVPPKKSPEITAFNPGCVLVTRKTTCPLTFQTW